jgi:hypothetical protein
MTKSMKGTLEFSTENWLAIYCFVLVKYLQTFQNTFRLVVKIFTAEEYTVYQFTDMTYV